MTDNESRANDAAEISPSNMDTKERFLALRAQEPAPPRVTVLMAVYNGEQYLAASISSVLEQDFSDFEFLIIDDNSTDGTRGILSHFEAKDSRVRVVRQPENLGLGACLALGVEISNGYYIVRMDADDLSLPDRVGRQVRFLDEQLTVDVLGGGAIEIDAAGNQGKVRLRPEHHDDIVRSVWACPLIHPTVAFRRSAILRAGNYDPKLRRRQDYDLWFRCVNEGLKFHNLQDPLIYYRFDQSTHKKQGFIMALQQARIGLRGCHLLGRPLWQKFAVTVPLWRSVLPARVQHSVYRALSSMDPRGR